MANPVSKSDVRMWKAEPYADIRSRLRSGDLFFTSGYYFVSKGIQFFTKSPWSHIGIIMRVPQVDRVLLLESVEDMGVRFAPLSKYLSDYEGNKPYKGELVIARADGVTDEVVRNIAAFGLDELTRPYDKDEIAKIMLRIALGIGKQERDREYICSELVWECFAKAGIEFPYNSKGYVSPADIWIDPRVKLVSRITT